jgi:hypothetical protein
MSEQLPHAKRIKSVLHVTVPALLGCRAAFGFNPDGSGFTNQVNSTEARRRLARFSQSTTLSKFRKNTSIDCARET